MKKPSATLNTDPLLKIGEAAKILGVSIDTLRRWEKSGRINTVKTPAGTRFYSLKALRAINPDLEHTNQIVNPSAKPEPLTTEELLREIKEEGKELVQIKSKYPTPKPSSLYSTFPQSTVFNPPSSIVNSDSIGVKILLSHFFPVAILALALPVLLFSFLINPKITQQFGLNIANDSSVLAATAGSAFLEVNTDVQISGSLWVSDLINDLKIEATPSANTLALSSGTTSLTVTKSATLDQDVSTASSPTFATPTVAGLNLSAAKDQLVFQSGGPSGTLTWTPSSVQVITLPNATGTVLLDSATQTITNKTISGSSNTITNLPNSALANKKVTVTAGTNLTGGGDVELGSSVTLALKDSPSISGTLTVAGATTLSSTLAVTGATTLSSTLTAGSSTLSSLSVTGATTLTGAATLSSTLDVTGNVGVGGTATFSNPLIVNSQIKITGGSPGTNKVLTSDSNGLATWTSVTAAGGVSGSGTQNYVPKFDSSSSITNSLIYDDGTNIGIGTATPGSALSVIGNIGIGTSAAGAALQVNGGGLFGWGTALTSLSSGAIAGFNGNVGIGTTSPRMPLEVWGNGTNTATFLNGNVGIGTTVPGEKLEVNGGIIRVDNSVNPGIDFYVSGGQESIIRAASGADEIITGSATGDLTIRTTTNNILFSTNNGSSAQMYINTSGNVGIGTTVPTTELEIGGTISPTLRMNPSDNSGAAIQLERYNSSGNYFNIESGAGNRATLELYYTGTTGFTLDTSGNVGIGTSSPRMPLEVWGNGTNAATFLNGNVGIGFTSPDRITQIASDIDITGSLSSLLGAGGTQFAITGSTGTTLQKKLTLGLDTTNNYGVIQAGNTSGTAYNLALQPGGGNVGIGITSPTAPLEVFGAGSLESTTVIRVTVSGDVFPGYNMQRKNAVTKTNAGWGMYIGSAGDFQIQDETNDAYKNVFRLEPGSINNLIYGVGGNLGIGGISTPVGLLDVNRKLNVLSNGNVGIGNTSPSQVFQVNADTSNPFVVTSGGNVGIGTTSPVYPLHMVSSTQYSVFINMKNTYGGGDSQLNLYADQGASWIYPNNKDLILSHDGSAKVLTIKSSGNVGIGTTVAGAALQVNGGGLFGWGTALTSLSSGSIAGFNGNVGVGTTSPLANLHVVGQCVAKGTRIRRRRRKSTSDGGDEGDSSEVDWEDVPIEDIQPDDEVLSLNDATGEFEWRKVEKTLDKGIQEVLALTTSSNKRILTTKEHPYLVIDRPLITQGTFEVDQSIRIEELGKATVIGIALGKLMFSAKLDQNTKKEILRNYQKRNKPEAFAYETFAQAVALTFKAANIYPARIIIDIEYPGFNKGITNIIKQTLPDAEIIFKQIGKHSPAHLACYGVTTGKRLADTILEYRHGGIEAKKKDRGHKALRTVTHQDKSLMIRNPHGLNLGVSYYTNRDLSRAKWTKVSQIKVGQYVATTTGFEKVTGIQKIKRLQTYDLQIEGTHNFVGNDIVAHNTVITGNVGIGTLLPTAIFQVNPSSGVTPFVVTSSGNVGIGRTNPQYPFDLTYSSTGNGFRIQRDAGSGPADVLNIDFNGAFTYDPNGTFGSTTLNFGNNITASTTDFFVINPSINNTGNLFNVQKASTSKFLINTDGNVGIGTTNPSAIFAVGTGATSNFTVTSTGNLGIGGTATFNNPAIFNSNVGIGTSIPVAPLTIKSTGSDDSTFALRIYNSSSTELFHLRDNGYTVIGSGSYLSSIPLEVSNSPYTHGDAAVQIGVLDTRAIAQGVGGGIGFMGKVNSSAYGFYGAIKGYKANATADDYSGQLHFQTRKNNEASKTRMVIDENGNVGIGTSAPISPTSRLSILGGNVGIGTSAAGASLAVNGNGVIGWGTALVAGPSNGLAVSGNVGIGTTTPSQALDVVGNARFRSVGSGTYANDLNLTADGTLTTLTSDITMKTNLETISGALDKLMQLKPYTFNWIDDPNGPRNLGLVAQEVAQTLPEITFTNQTDGKMGINYSKFAPLLIAAIQEQQANIGNLTTQVTQLGSQLTGLSDKVTTNNVKTLSLDLGSGTIASTSAGLAINLTPGADFQISNDTNSVLLNITASGNVGIGTSNPQAALDVKASGPGIIARFNSDNSTGCTLSDTGTISCTSDKNLKKNIEDLNYGLGTLMELKPVSFNWNSQDDSSTKNLGFIAQDVENIIPNLVSTDPKTGVKQLNTIGLIPVLVKSVQQQQTAINDLIASEATASAILSHFKVDSFGNVGIGSSASGLKVDRLILSASDTKSSSLSSDGSNLIYIDKDNAISNVLTTSTPAYFDLNSRVASVESKGNTLEERIKSLEDRLAQLATAQVAGVATESGQLSGLSSQSSATSSSVISQPVNRQQTNQILTTENRTPITNISTSSAQITPEATASALVATPSASVIPSRAPGGEEESFASISTSSGKIASSSSTPRNDISKLDLTPPDILFATASTQVADLKVTSDATVSGQLTAYEATIQETFKALGKTFLSKTTIAGDLTVNGGMSITQDSINTIGILHIQNSALAKGVDFLNGLVKIDGSGAVWVQKLAVSKKTLGTDIIPAGQTDVAIVTDAITNKSKVFITAQSSTSGKSLFVSYQEPSLGFIVSLDSAMEIDVKFNWFLVDQSD